MKRQKNQSGSIDLIVILVLVVALLGAIGFIYWQHRPASSKNTTSTDSSITTLDIPQLRVGLLYDKSLPTIGYTFHEEANGIPAYADITSKSLIGTACVDDTGSIAQIIKNPTSTSNFSESPIVATATVDSAKYVLTLSGSNCASNTTLLSQYQSSIEHNFINLKAN